MQVFTLLIFARENIEQTHTYKLACSGRDIPNVLLLFSFFLHDEFKYRKLAWEKKPWISASDLDLRNEYLRSKQFVRSFQTKVPIAHGL